MTWANATEVFCRYCGAEPGQFCLTAFPCEQNSHHSRWIDSQGKKIERLEKALAELKS